MDHVPSDRIRNVALVGHSGAGTTTLAEALLAIAAASTPAPSTPAGARAATPDAGAIRLDHEPEAIKRKISIALSVAPIEWRAADGQTYRINLIDTPGYPDFVGDVDAALAVADLAVFVVSAVDGVEVGTELVWRRAADAGVARLVFVNKADRDRADFDSVLAQLRATFGGGFVPLDLPLGTADSLHGVADVLSEEAIEYEPGGAHRGALPDDVADHEHQVHDEVVEEIVSGDDAALERYLGGETPDVADLAATLAGEVLAGTAYPVLVGSALNRIGLDRLCDFVCEIGPSPVQRPVAVDAGDTVVEIPADAAGDAAVYVFKTVSDPFVGQLSLFKVISGTVRADTHLVNSTSGTDERLHALVTLRGREQTPVAAIPAGGIGAVAKLTATRTGDTLAPRGSPVRVRHSPPPAPNYSVAIVAHTQADDDKLSTALARLRAEDPTLLVERVDETHQTVLRTFGDAHVAVTLERLARSFGVNVDLEELRVPYRESITASAAAEGRVKKQTGGHGQFAVVNLVVGARARGEGFEFVDSVVGGAIPRNYLPAVVKGIEEAMATGGAFGFPVVDVRVECVDGRSHAVDSSEMAFKTAAAQGFRDALAAAAPVVLEPISLVEVHVAAVHQGDVMGDITARRGRLQGTDVDAHGDQVITALVPSSELARYAIDLRSMTSGRAWFEARHDHYDVLPAHLVDSVVAAARAAAAGAASATGTHHGADSDRSAHGHGARMTR